MPAISHTSVLAYTPIDPRHRAAMAADEFESRRYTGDFSCPPQINLRKSRSSLSDDGDGLRRIPSTSTGFLDDDAISVYTSSSGTLTITSCHCLQVPVPSRDEHEQFTLTEAQRIALQYQEHHRSRPDVFQSTTISESTTQDVSPNLLDLQYCAFLGPAKEPEGTREAAGRRRCIRLFNSKRFSSPRP